MTMTMPETKLSVLCYSDLAEGRLEALLAEYGLEIHVQQRSDSIVGSFWGDEEAGLVANRLYVRPDTPVHSALHEACHYICMDDERRSNLHTDAGGGYDEENGVCYLQILMSERIPEMGRQRMLDDMDAWGYSFRLGSAGRWFYEDAEDALVWLQKHRVLDSRGALAHHD